MGSVRLYAIAIDEVREIFGAPEQVAGTLRGIAAGRFAQATPASPGLLARLGPVFRRQPDAPVVRPGVPSGSDVDTLLAGRYVPPHRLTACWVLFETWLDALSWGSLGQELSEARLNDFDFDLVRSEVPARLGLRHLLRNDLGIPLLPHPGLAAGWAAGDHVHAMARTWRPVVDRLEDPHRDIARAVLAWLDAYPGWEQAAAAAHRPAPDLVAILRA